MSRSPGIATPAPGLLDGRASSLKTRDGHSERGTRDVVQSHLIEEVNRIWISTMFTAHAARQSRSS
ncbi:MAG: hypothetical protein L7U42_01730, partial [Candidatus Nanopelagicales bacterium]|nr:hypothetical protein [Candidatus Nanopelagicales bacterium]